MGLALLLVGMLAGAAGVHAVQSLERARFLNSGLFTLAAGEGVNFNATLDDNARRSTGQGPDAVVRCEGHRRRASGRTARGRDSPRSLAYRLPGVFRAQAQIVETRRDRLEPRRIVVSTIEIFGLRRVASNQTGETRALGVAIPRRFVCSSDDGGGNGRLPD